MPLRFLYDCTEGALAMSKFIIKRILVMIPVLLGVTFVIFTMMYFTDGNPAQLILGDMATEEQIHELEEEMGLNDPFFTRYLNYLSDLLHGDLGTSYVTGQPVAKEIMDRLPVTVRISFCCMIFAVAVGIPAGILSAVKQYSILDNLSMVLALVGISLPNFWLALMLVLVFSVGLGLLPPSGLYGFKYYILPVVSISASAVATITRMTRSSMLEVIRADYIRTARAKGQSENVVIFRHALLNALFPIITVVGLQFATTLSGTVVNEQIFAIPGLGKLMVDAIKARNYPVVQGGVFVLAFIFSILNLVIDLIYAFVDPRIRSQYVRKKNKRQAETDNRKEVPA